VRLIKNNEIKIELGVDGYESVCQQQIRAICRARRPVGGQAASDQGLHIKVHTHVHLNANIHIMPQVHPHSAEQDTAAHALSRPTMQTGHHGQQQSCYHPMCDLLAWHGCFMGSNLQNSQFM